MNHQRLSLSIGQREYKYTRLKVRSRSAFHCPTHSRDETPSNILHRLHVLHFCSSREPDLGWDCCKVTIQKTHSIRTFLSIIFRNWSNFFSVLLEIEWKISCSSSDTCAIIMVFFFLSWIILNHFLIYIVVNEV